MDKQSLIIIGAGAAGLMSARTLSGKYNITILEASSSSGGRIRSKQLSHSSKIIEAGPEFIHGHQKLTLQLLKEAGISYVAVEGKMYRKDMNQLVEQTEMIEGWDQLLKQMKKVKTDMTMRDFLDQYFGEEKHADLRRYATNYTEGFDLADVNKASVQSLYKEWSNEEEENFRIPSGYSSLINFLKEDIEKKGVRILTNHIARQIDWEPNNITVYTANEQKFYAEKIIITIPVSILRKAGDKSSINFTPPLDNYIKAAGDIGAGNVVKVSLLFHLRFWKEDAGFIFSDEIFPTWWTQLPDTIPLLTGWAGGIKAKEMSDQTDKEILEKAILSLASIFTITPQEVKNNLKESFVFNWKQEQGIEMAYTYSTLATSSARKLLDTSIDNTIFFAGEALYDGASPGTVEAALVSGKKVAEMILD